MRELAGVRALVEGRGVGGGGVGGGGVNGQRAVN